MTVKKKAEPKSDAPPIEGAVTAGVITTASIAGEGERPKDQARIDMNDPSLSGREAVAKNLAEG